MHGHIFPHFYLCVGWRWPTQANRSFCCLCPCKSAYALCRKRVRDAKIKNKKNNSSTCAHILLAVTTVPLYKHLALNFRFCYTARGGFCFPEEAIQEFHGNQNHRRAFFLGRHPFSSTENKLKNLSNSFCGWKKKCKGLDNILPLSGPNVSRQSIKNVRNYSLILVQTTICNILFVWYLIWMLQILVMVAMGYLLKV